ncbi:MAG: hypothetical protein ABSA12_14505 [Verrucomicrobiia bacterium]|jgi:hypothetical protein
MKQSVWNIVLVGAPAVVFGLSLNRLAAIDSKIPHFLCNQSGRIPM